MERHHFGSGRMTQSVKMTILYFIDPPELVRMGLPLFHERSASCQCPDRQELRRKAAAKGGSAAFGIANGSEKLGMQVGKEDYDLSRKPVGAVSLVLSLLHGTGYPGNEH